MADLESQQLDMNQPLLELDRPVASPYFEDYLFKIIEDLQTLDRRTITNRALSYFLGE